MPCRHHPTCLMYRNGTQHLNMSLYAFDWLFTHEVVDIELSLLRTSKHMSVFAVKGNINAELSNSVPRVLLDLRPSALLDQTNYI